MRAPRLSAAELRTLRAFAEAMAPGVAGLPPAAGPDVRTAPASAIDVGPVLAGYLAALPRRRLRMLKLGLRAFEWAPFPWRFSRADLSARQSFIARMDTSERWLPRDLVLLLKVLTGLAYANDRRVKRAVGYTAACRVLDEARDAGGARDLMPLGELRPTGDGEECDVAIVGSGAGGAVAATVLAEAGHDVLVLEAGPYLDRRSYPEEPVAALLALYRDGGLTVAEGVPAIPTPVGRAVGGTTVINSGTCFRAPGPVLARWARQHGIDWALELERDYAQAEQMLNVTPVDPARMGRNGQILMEAAEALGVAHEPLRRNAGRCVGCSSCPMGCRIDAKRAMHVSYLPRAVAAGARIRAGVDVRRVLFEGRRAIGLDCLIQQGAERAFSVIARRGVIIAGGAFGTPELLLRSEVHSPSDAVGRNLRIHPACWVGARFDEEVRGWDGVMQSYAVTEWAERGILLEATFTPLAFGAQWLPGTGAPHQERIAAYDRIASTGVHLSDRSSGHVRLARDGSLRVGYQLTGEDAAKLMFGIARAAELYYAAGAREVYPQIAGIPIVPRGRVADLESRPPSPTRLRLEAFHPLGTARMDADPGRGVVGTDGSVHGYEALYIADGSVLPGSIGVNPMMTIIAMASRISRAVAERLA